MSIGPIHVLIYKSPFLSIYPRRLRFKKKKDGRLVYPHWTPVSRLFHATYMALWGTLQCPTFSWPPWHYLDRYNLLANPDHYFHFKRSFKGGNVLCSSLISWTGIRWRGCCTDIRLFQRCLRSNRMRAVEKGSQLRNRHDTKKTCSSSPFNIGETLIYCLYANICVFNLPISSVL